MFADVLDDERSLGPGGPGRIADSLARGRDLALLDTMRNGLPFKRS